MYHSSRTPARPLLENGRIDTGCQQYYSRNSGAMDHGKPANSLADRSKAVV